MYGISTSNDVELPNVYGAGVANKYVFKKTGNLRFFKRIRFFTKADFILKNYTSSEKVLYHADEFSFDLPLTDSKIKYAYTSASAGLRINTGNQLSFEIIETGIYHKGEYTFGTGLNIIWSFNNFKRKPKTESNQELVPINTEPEQEKNNKFFLKNFKAGTSLTYIPNSNETDYPVGENLYEEYTWNVNFAASINKHLNIGVQLMTIFTSGTHVDDYIYNIYGIFTQYDLLANRAPKYALFIESSINTGNYCTAGHLDPYKKNNMWYAGLGGGFEFPVNFIINRLSFELSAHNYQIINNLKTKYNYTQYIIGLNYNIVKLKGMSQTYLAMRINGDNSKISRIERGDIIFKSPIFVMNKLLFNQKLHL